MQTLKSLQTLSAASVILAVSSFSSVATADFSEVPSGNYASDPTHAYINFSYNHLGFSNPTLSFDEFAIEMNLDTEDPTKTTVSVSIDTDSVLTGSDIWKEHLTSENWLNTAEFPKITFESTSVESTGDSTYTVAGNLTVKDMTKPATFDITVNGAKPHPRSKKPIVGIDASGNMLRSDFGLGKNAPFVSDELSLSITAEMVGSE